MTHFYKKKGFQHNEQSKWSKNGRDLNRNGAQEGRETSQMELRQGLKWSLLSAKHKKVHFPKSKASLTKEQRLSESKQTQLVTRYKDAHHHHTQIHCRETKVVLKFKYLHGSSCFRTGRDEGEQREDDADGAVERPATLSTVTGTESEPQAGTKCWFRV